MKRFFIILTILIVGGAILGFAVDFWKNASVSNAASGNSVREVWTSLREQNDKVEGLIESRRKAQVSDEDVNPFGDKDEIKILFIGLDKRVGQTQGHCDAIQLITINRVTDTIAITAVPRGTYAPLPGTGHKATDYYVSNSCGIGGLDYGIKQIEHILGQQADYVVFVGFSQSIGIFRQLGLPTVETMQWLRHRQGYAIGEPQRARNHSNFIKQMMVKYADTLDSAFSVPGQYIIYKLIDTDLSFGQIRKIADEIASFDITNHPEKISLYMRPAYNVQDFNYDPDTLDEKLSALIDPIAPRIVDGSYTGDSIESVQARLVKQIAERREDPEFVKWAYENFIWLQVEDDNDRETIHFDIMKRYALQNVAFEEQETIITDYIVEMQDLGKQEWADKAQALLLEQFTLHEEAPANVASEDVAAQE